MALPKLRVPEYFTKLPSNGKEIKFRPYLVGEQKTLLVAIESKDVKEIYNAILNIINECILTPGIKAEKLASYDVEWLFIKMREHSVGGQIALMHNHVVDEEEFEVPVKVNLANVKYENPNVNNKILLEEETGIGVVLKHPTLEMSLKISDFQEEMSQTELTFKFVEECIESIFDKDEVYTDFPDGYVHEFVNSMTETQRQKVMAFFKDAPYVYLDISYICPKTNNTINKRLSGITDFFI
ncbi:baseplate wedge protein [Ochrobactrum phage vB_OspM_OC]|nr:baseplate wedge protein [Ochrobactrum phage vB_OspM_OC]